MQRRHLANRQQVILVAFVYHMQRGRTQRDSALSAFGRWPLHANAMARAGLLSVVYPSQPPRASSALAPGAEVQKRFPTLIPSGTVIDEANKSGKKLCHTE